MTVPPHRPSRNQIGKKKPMPVWRVPMMGPVTPRLQKQQQGGPVADAVGFYRLEEGSYFEGAWVRGADGRLERSRTIGFMRKP
jgi:hypothetical protein